MKPLTPINVQSIVLIILFPIIGLYNSITKLRWHQKKWSLIVFVTVFGSIMLLPETADAFRHQQNVYDHYMGLPFVNFVEELWKIVLFNPSAETNDDVYIHFLSYISGSILNSPKLFFVFVSLIYGYFYISALSKVLRWSNDTKISFTLIITVFLFIIFCGIENMQSIRTWTGAWILFNGVFGYFQTRKKKYVLLILATPLVHVAYSVMALPALLIIFVKKLPPIFFISIYALSFFFININQEFVVGQFNRTKLGESKVRGYYNPDANYFDKFQDKKVTWYAKYGKAKSSHWASNALAFTFILGGLYRKRMNKLERYLFSTGLLIATFANFGDFVPSFYNRTMINAGLYILATTVLLAKRGELLQGRRKHKAIKIMFWGSILIFIPKVVFTFSDIIYYSSFYIFGAPFLGWFPDLNISIRELIGWFL